MLDLSDDAEKAVLGSLLRRNEEIPEVLLILSAEDFYPDAHQTIFRAIADLHNSGKPVDLTLLAGLLHQRNKVDDIGGYDRLSELWEAGGTGSEAVHYANVVREKSLYRRLALLGEGITKNATDHEEPAAELLEQAERDLFALAERGAADRTVLLGDALNRALDRYDDRATRRDGAGGIPTGFLDLDGQTGGLHDASLIIVGARPSVGKTALGLAIATHAAIDLGLSALFVSLEMSVDELADRVLAARGELDSRKLRKALLSADEVVRMADAAETCSPARLVIDDAPGQSMLRIGANARRLKRRYGIRLVVVDYLQLVEPENRKEPRQEQVAGISRRLKGLAKELNVPVIALAQLNRASEDRQNQKPRLSDLRESGSIEADADVVLLLHRHEGEPGAVQVLIAKHRNGPPGAITLAWRAETMQFQNYAGGSNPFSSEAGD